MSPTRMELRGSGAAIDEARQGGRANQSNQRNKSSRRFHGKGVSLYRRGWNLDDPQKLLESLLQAPGPKSKGLQSLIDYVNGQRGPSTVHRGSSRNARKPKAESTPAAPPDEQSDDPATCRVELTVGGITFWRLITPAEADKVLALSSRSWLKKSA